MKKILTFLFPLFLLTACSDITHNDYRFTGESEHWEAEYSYTGTETRGEDNGIGTYSNEDSHKFTLTYKGSLEELSSMRKLEYLYSTLSSNGKSTEEFTEPTTTKIFSSSGGSTNGAKVTKDEVILVKVKWDDVEESILLDNKKLTTK